ncbi:MAG: family 20 glycosylhydrolase, partial [Duncaniella sp.]|nr:family 20 glycosylhydrolase [Duncaniella sp.]
ALKACPYLGCTGGPYVVWTLWGVSPDVLCAGNDSTYRFIDDVLGEIIDIFPSKYIHIGGDECPKDRWEECPKCQAKIKALGLKKDAKGTPEEKLQSHLIHHATDFLTSRGRNVIGWDEILEGGLAPGAIVMSWRGQGGGIEAARQDHDVIMVPNDYFYFDYYQSVDVDKEPIAIGGYVPLEKVYSFQPIPSELTPEQGKHILGVQANLWTEYIPTFSQAQYMELPRMAALAEVQWSDAPKDYEGFLQRLCHLVKHYDASGYNYARHIFDVTGTLTPDVERKAIVVTLSTVDDAPIHYTLDGSDPTASSPVYTDPIVLDGSTLVKAVAIRPSGESRQYSASVNFNKATGRPVALLTSPHPRYAAKGGATLTDGLRGYGSYNSGRWLGYSGPLVAEIELDEGEEISQLTFSNKVETGSWIFDIRAAKVEVSDDGNTYT